MRTDDVLTASILALLDRRAAGASICPSEVARSVAEETGQEWRDLMEPVRRAAARLAAAGALEVTQGGHAVDPSAATGPVRLRRPA